MQALEEGAQRVHRRECCTPGPKVRVVLQYVDCLLSTAGRCPCSLRRRRSGRNTTSSLASRHP
eukprot:3269858-Pyramimonas_sp.AAC.1